MIKNILKLARCTKPVLTPEGFSASKTYESYSAIQKLLLKRINRARSRSNKFSVLTPRVLYGYKLLYDINYSEWVKEPGLKHFMSPRLYQAIVLELDTPLRRSIISKTGPASVEKRVVGVNILSVDDWDSYEDEEYML